MKIKYLPNLSWGEQRLLHDVFYLFFFKRNSFWMTIRISGFYNSIYFAWFCPICVFLQNKAWRRQIWNFANGMMGLMFISDFAKISNEKIFYVVQSYSAPKPNRPKTIENLRSIIHKYSLLILMTIQMSFIILAPLKQCVATFKDCLDFVHCTAIFSIEVFPLCSWC